MSPMPYAGSQPSLTEKATTIISASQKAGTLTPSMAMNMQMRSAHPLRCVAATMPSGVPIPICKSMQSTAITSV